MIPIPLRDTIPSRHYPVVNYMLIGACLLGFWLELDAGPGLELLIHEYGLIPARLSRLLDRGGLFQLQLWGPLLSSMFLHGGWAHLLGNLLYLWIFGDNVEDRFGHVGYALFYLGGGLAAGCVHVLANPGSVIPTVGASGAIAAVMGAYFVLYPRAQVVTAVIFLVFVRTITLPATLYLGAWLVLQLIAGTAELGAAPGETGAGVAWWAHLGGFAFGVAVIAVLGRRPARAGR